MKEGEWKGGKEGEWKRGKKGVEEGVKVTVWQKELVIMRVCGMLTKSARSKVDKKSGGDEVLRIEMCMIRKIV